MAIRASTFLADNIVALLQAAPQGGTIEQVIERAGVQVGAASLKKWIADGKRDKSAGKNTAYRMFSEQWALVYPGAPPKGEPDRMIEMQKALEKMGLHRSQNGQIANGSEPPRQRAPSGSRQICECGNPKKSTAVACDACRAIDARTVAA